LGGLRGRILQGDRVNEIKLAEIELDGDPRTTSNAYFLAGVTEMQGGNPARASAYFASGLRADAGAVETDWNGTPSRCPPQGQYDEAVRELEHASR
jgi:hypothetical protein